MTKTKENGPDYGKVSEGLLKRIKKVIADGDAHRYSVSLVYGAYNEAFGKRDIPQTCSSCLSNRVRELRKYMGGYNAYMQAKAQAEAGEALKDAEGTNGKGEDKKAEEEPKSGATLEPQYDDPCAPGFVAPAMGVIRFPMPEGLPFDFTPNEGEADRGTIKQADGMTVKPGTYTAACGFIIAVQPGGKATIKKNDDPKEEGQTDDNAGGSDEEDLI